MKKKTPYDVVVRKLLEGCAPVEAAELLGRAQELHENYSSLFPGGIMSPLQVWNIAFVSGYRHKRKEEG